MENPETHQTASAPEMSVRQIVGSLLRFFRPVAVRVSVNSLVGIGSVSASLLFVWLTKRLVDIATGVSSDSLTLTAILLAAALLAQSLLQAWSRRLDLTTQIDLGNRLRLKIFTHLINRSWTGRRDFHSADVVNRVETDTASVTALLCTTVPGVVVTSVQLIAAFVFLAWLNWRLALAVVVIMPFAIIVSKIFIRRTRALTREIRTADSRLQSILQENLQNRLLLAAMGGLKTTVNTFTEAQEQLSAKVNERGNLSIFSRSALQLGFMAGYAVALLWSVVGLRDGAITFGMMTAFLQLVGQIQRPTVDLVQRLPAFIHTSVSVERIEQLLSLPLEPSGEQIDLGNEITIDFNDVTFAYPDDDSHKAVIKNFTYRFERHTLTAIAGETGIGKSTLLRLLLGFISPQAGSITLRGSTKGPIEVSPLTRCNFIFVPQGNSLMSGTIRSNLQLAHPDATEAQMKEALHTAAAEFVFTLPLGLDTPCGEKGGGLSEGQAQRIAIARGLLRQGGVMILDEPTSALDAETERILLQRLTASATDKTIIVVTHHERLLGLCDDVLLM